MIEIRVLGPGCSNCERLERIAYEAVEQLDIPAHVTKVTDYNEILAQGVLTTPGLIVNGQVVCSGRVPSLEEVKGWLKNIGTNE